MNTMIYFLRPVGALGPIKIGCSKHPLDRLNAVMRMSPQPLEIVASAPGDFKLEYHLLDRFKAHRLHFEWFDAASELQAGIASVSAGATIEEAFSVHRSERKDTYAPGGVRPVYTHRPASRKAA